MAKNQRKQISSDKLNFLPTYEQFQDAFEEFHELTKNMKKLIV